MEDCVKLNDLAFARRVEKAAREGKCSFPANAYDAFLKVCVAHADVYSLDVFHQMQKDGA